MFERRRKRGWLNKALEKVEDIPTSALTLGQPMTDSAKRKLHEKGFVGQAEVLKAPSKKSVSDVAESNGFFTVRVELPDREPYEARVMCRRSSAMSGTSCGPAPWSSAGSTGAPEAGAAVPAGARRGLVHGDGLLPDHRRGQARDGHRDPVGRHRQDGAGDGGPLLHDEPGAEQQAGDLEGADRPARSQGRS